MTAVKTEIRVNMHMLNQIKVTSNELDLGVFYPSYCFVLIIVDIVRVWDKQEAVPPFFAFLQILKERAREDGLVLQRNLWVKT